MKRLVLATALGVAFAGNAFAQDEELILECSSISKEGKENNGTYEIDFANKKIQSEVPEMFYTFEGHYYDGLTYRIITMSDRLIEFEEVGSNLGVKQNYHYSINRKTGVYLADWSINSRRFSAEGRCRKSEGAGF